MTSAIPIRVEHLSKRYRIACARPRPDTLREALMAGLQVPLPRLASLFRCAAPKDSLSSAATEDRIWALQDISFEVKQGEVLGIIGRNGAGKSTLLKILSRITEPTQGRVGINGRVGSLLEVGTGFHPELTGRENIYLNGAILGMSKAETTRKFDQIVAFAEIERFLDTPVKRYSSGMYVRLAFAVAAHLEPDILLVDEVLAVGDATFQKKCLGKMGNVAHEGRTVLFVSHNMQAIQSLCHNAFQLEAGRLVAWGDSRSVVAGYLSTLGGAAAEATWPEDLAPGNEELRLTAVRVVNADGVSTHIYPSCSDIHVELEFTANSHHPALCVGFDLVSSAGVVVARSYQTDLPPEKWPPIRREQNRWCCVIPGGLLNAGIYYVCPKIGLHNMYWIVNLDATVRFEVILDHGVSPFWNALDGRTRPGVIAPILPWCSQDRQ